MLDIGCGTGDFTRNVLLPWSKPCREMVAVDALPGMIQYAKANHPHPEITYEVLDAGSRDISKFLEKHGKFDRVYSFYCFHWIKDQDVAFANVSKLLKDDGECLFLFLSQFVFYDVWQEMASKERWRDIIGDPLQKSFRNLGIVIQTEFEGCGNFCERNGRRRCNGHHKLHCVPRDSMRLQERPRSTRHGASNRHHEGHCFGGGEAKHAQGTGDQSDQRLHKDTRQLLFPYGHCHSSRSQQIQSMTFKLKLRACQHPSSSVVK
ncbi:juvenile hormone acid O-methyltransferase isoform X3 [Ixodes scapularis]